MKILSISSDRKVFEKGSAVRARLLEYGSLVDELHVIIFAKSSHGFSPETIAPNIFIYPTDSANIFFYIADAISRARSLKRRGIAIELVTTQDPFESGIAGFRIAHIFGVRLHIQIHTDFMSKYFARESLLNRGRVSIAKYLLRRADGVRVVSSRIKKSMQGLVRHGVSIDVLPIFVEQPLNKEISPDHDLRRKYPQFDFTVLVVARLAQEKNIGSVIESMVSVVKMRPKAGLIIVGEGPEKAQLEDFITRLGLEEHVIFEGWQNNVFSYYKTADVFVLPSLYEGYGMAAVEAAHAGCTVVMTDVGCAGDVIKDGVNGLIVPAGDTWALTQAVERVVSGKVKLGATVPLMPTKQEYLAAYKKSWELASTPQKTRLCYVLPEFRKDDATHFSHIHDFLKEITKKFDVYLLVEKGEIPGPELGYRAARVMAFQWFPFRFLETLFMVIWLRMKGYKNVYVHYSFLAAFLASVVMRPTGGRVFYWNCGEPWKYKRAMVRDFFERKTYKAINFLVTGANSLALQYAKNYRISINKIKVMPNWIDLKRFSISESKEMLRRELGLPLDKKIILFVHHLSPRKGAHYILPVLRELRKKRQDIFFVVAGSGPYEETLRKELANDSGLSNAMRLEGKVSNQKMPTYFSAVDAFFMPSEEEGFPRVLLEAMALGTPFVASNVGATKDITPAIMHKYILEQGNIDGFASSINEILNQDDATRANVTRELKKWADLYDAPIVAEKFSDLFK